MLSWSLFLPALLPVLFPSHLMLSNITIISSERGMNAVALHIINLWTDIGGVGNQTSNRLTSEVLYATDSAPKALPLKL